MKLLLVTFILLLSSIECHVTRSLDVPTDRTVTVNGKNASDKKYSDYPMGKVVTIISETTVKGLSENNKDNHKKVPGFQTSDETVSQSVLVEAKNVSRHKGSDYDAKRVYLEDVVFSLKNQNWTKDELPCLNDTLHLLRSLQNFTLWAVWDWDSISSQPQGLLFGNRYELGNFDECLSAPWAATHPELHTQYCLAEIVLERSDNRRKKDAPVLPYESALDYIMRKKTSIHRPLNELTWGCCVPVSCSGRAVERLMATLLARSHLGAAGLRARIASTEDCQRHDSPRPFDATFYGFLFFVAILVLVALLCTYLNCKRNDEVKSFKDEVVQAFCLKENAKDLLNMKKEGAEVMYGIRFLTIVFIVMDHQIGIFNSGPIINGLQVDQAAVSVAGMFVLHDDLFVDTFFVLSGFLVAMAFMRLKDKPFFNPLVLIVKRYIRLVVAFAVMIFYYAAVYPYTGSGPLWNRSVQGETVPCRQNWWLSLLMLSNYVDNENICIVISWYIPCDFHFFLVTTLVFWVYTRNRRLGVACTAVVTVLAVGTPGVINYMRGLPAIQLFTYDFVKNPRANEQFHATYIKSHARFPAYIIGVFAGYIFCTYRDSGTLQRISKKWAILGAVASLTIMTGVMVVGATYLWRSYHPLEGAVYAALNRPIWACGVAMLLICCCLGRVPYIEGFLTWYPWVPLSRLSYGLYLTHTAIITRNVYVTRSAQYNDLMTLLTSSLGVVTMGCGAALAIWLFAEAPVNNLFSVFVKSRIKRVTPESANPAASQVKVTPMPSTSRGGHLHTNLPTSIEISSKM